MEVALLAGPLAAAPSLQQVVSAVIGFVFFTTAALVFVRVSNHLVRYGGRVEASEFGLPDLLTGGTLALFFIATMVEALQHRRGAETDVSLDNLLPAQLFLIAIVAGVGGFMLYRRLNPARVFGLGRLSLIGSSATAVLFLVASMPVIAVTNYLTVLMLRDLASEQDLVGLFRDLSRDGDYSAMTKAFVATVLLAPPCEEFLFRGYFYGVSKRYLGAFPAALATSLLFAAFHLNLASLPGLFVLALCLTAAYERTGSLLVPIGMHALYNSTSLVMLYLQSQGKVPTFQP